MDTSASTPKEDLLPVVSYSILSDALNTRKISLLAEAICSVESLIGYIKGIIIREQTTACHRNASQVSSPFRLYHTAYSISSRGNQSVEELSTLS